MKISDHALVRYIERFKGESLDNVRAEMIALLEKHRETPAADQETDFIFIIVEGDTVVTVLAPPCRPKRRLLHRIVHVPKI